MNRLTIKFVVVCVLVLLLVDAMEAAAPTLAQSPTVVVTKTPPDITFPDLTGPYNVGRSEYEWVDQTRDDPFASIPGLKRDLMVYIWFPASPTKRSKIAPYMDSLMWDIWSKHPLPLSNVLSSVSGLESSVHSRAYRTNHLDQDKSSYPVLIFVPGFSATSLNYASILEDIASHGYIVIGTSHPYTTPVISYPDGRLVVSGLVGAANQGVASPLPAVLKIWTQDLAFVLNQIEQLNITDDTFKGYLDLSHVGVFGNNFGGAAAFEIAATDPRIKATVALSLGAPGTVLTDVIGDKPYLGMGEYFATNAADVMKQTQDKYRLTIDGTLYLNFGDFGLLVPLLPEIKQGTYYNIQIGSIDPARGIQIINSYLLMFFDHYLKGVDLNWPTYDEAHLTNLTAFATSTPAN